MAPKTVTLDFTDVKDGSLHRRTRFPEGDYKARILSVVDQLSSQDQTPMWVYTIEIKQGKKTGTYPFYCKIDPKNLWKLRSLFAAAGVVIPKKRFQVDPNKIVGKLIGVTLEDDEYKDKINSSVAGVIPLSEIADADDPEIDDQDDEDEDEDDEPVVVKKTKKRPAPVEPEDDEDEDDEEDEPQAKPVKAKRRKAPVEPEPEEDEDEEEDEEPTPPPVKKAKRKPAPVVEPDDEDEDDEPAPAPKKRTSKKARQIAAVSDDELDELDIDDL